MVACEIILTELLAWLCPWLPVFGYPVVFLVNLIGSASIILPVPGFALIFFLPALGFNPWILAIFGGLGATFGEITGYAVGVGGRKLAKQQKPKGFILKKERLIEKAEKWAEKRGLFAIIILFAATPLPHDIIGIIAGAIGYNLKRFLLATLIGKLILFSFLAWAGFFGMDMVLSFIGVTV